MRVQFPSYRQLMRVSKKTQSPRQSSGVARIFTSFFNRKLSITNCCNTQTVSQDNAVDTTLVKGAVVKWKDPCSLNLRRRGLISWKDSRPKIALLVKKRRDLEATQELQRIGEWLQRRDVHVVVEKLVKEQECPDFEAFDPELTDVDLCVTLGGDGTVLHLASLFAEDTPLPPVISFAMGTLGFLTPFDVGKFETHLTRILRNEETSMECTLRARKKCEVFSPSEKRQQVHHVLNECIIDRGASQSTITVDIHVDGGYIASVCSDGLIVATPSGSTAYSMTAGGPMVAPSVPCSIITPVAPLSLSFRPLVLPETSDVVLHLAPSSKSIGRASFDGRKQARILKTGSIRLTSSKYPLPLINIGKYDSDWYEGITQKLKWNQSIGQPTNHQP